MEYLRRRAFQHKRFSQSLLRFEAGWLHGGSSGADACPQEDSRHGRRRRGQYFYQDLSVLLWTVRLRRGAGDSAGDRAVSQLVLVQYLRNFFLVAGHSGAAFDLLREEAVQEDSRRNGRGRTVCRGARQVAHASALGEEADFVAQFLFGPGPTHPLGGARAHSSAAFTGATAGREVDAGALRDEQIGR